MAANPSPASTSRPVEGAALSSEQTVMTEFVIAITAFCSLIFIFCVAFVFLFAYCKRIHREEDEDDGEYIGDEESLPESQQSYSQARKNIYGHPQGHPVGHKNHVLSVWDTYPLYHVREMHVAQKFWQAEAVRNPMHMGPAVIY